jgi:hypothetical protein
MSRLSLPAAALALVGLLAVPTPAQPPADLPPGPPSPLELVRGLREGGSADLALEYLKDLEARPPKSLAPEDKQVIPLERAKCLLETADDEADEAARADRIAEAKGAFDAFRKAHPTHPRAAEASLALARLTALEARTELGKALRTEVAKDDDEGRRKQKAAAGATRQKFLDAAADFKAAADQIQAQIDGGKLDPKTKAAMDRERFEAALASGINQFNIADTFVNADATESGKRQDYVTAAMKTFEAMKKSPDTARAHWVGRAWLSECYYAISEMNKYKDEMAAIVNSKNPAAADGKRMVQFFELRRAYLSAHATREPKALADAEVKARAWLRTPGNDNPRRPSAEATAARFYDAVLLKDQAENTLRGVRADAKTGLYPMTGATRTQLDTAEKVFRQLAATENDYTSRAERYRLRVVRLMVGEATRPPQEYVSFEMASMAALVQVSKMADLDTLLGPDATLGPASKTPAATAALGVLSSFEEVRVAARRAHMERIIGILERARALATDRDPPADVANVLVMLIYFYGQTGQPDQAAVLGEYAARTLGKAAGNKPALAGAMAVFGYSSAADRMKAGAGLDDAKRADRDRAVKLALFLDEKFPADPATDRARHQLATLLYTDGRMAEAYEALVKIRPGYERAAKARLMEGAVAYQLLAASDKGAGSAGITDERRAEVFRRAVADLDKLPKPRAGADVGDVRDYLAARCRLALLYLIQYRADPDGEKATPGPAKSAELAREVLDLVTKADPPAYPCLYEGETKKLNPNGLEMRFLAEDARVRAAYSQVRRLLDAAKDAAGFKAAMDAAAPVLAEMANGPLVNDDLRKWAEEGAEDEAQSAFKARVVALADGVDKRRQEILIQALKARVQQNQADEAVKLIELLKQYGGSVEKNLYVFQTLTQEMQGRIITLRHEKREAEAKTMGDGFAKLLTKLSAEPNLPAQTQLFLGASLVKVGEFNKAVEILDRVPKPPAAKLAPDAFDGLDEAEQKQVQTYREAALNLVRALRQSAPPNFTRADILMKEAMGDAMKPGFGARMLSFHREQALVLESKGAAAGDLKQANAEYGAALKKWGELVRSAQSRWEKSREDKAAQGADLIRNRNSYLDAYFEYQRCLFIANKKILQKAPDKFQKVTEDVGRRFAVVESTHPANEIADAVRDKYRDFLEEQPQLKAAFQKAAREEHEKKAKEAQDAAAAAKDADEKAKQQALAKFHAHAANNPVFLTR